MGAPKLATPHIPRLSKQWVVSIMNRQPFLYQRAQAEKPPARNTIKAVKKPGAKIDALAQHIVAAET